MNRLLKQFLSSSFFTYTITMIVRTYLMTVRCKTENDDIWQKEIENGNGILVCMFHQQFFFIVRFFRKYLRLNPALIISQSKDGEIGAKIAIHSGAQAIRGSSSKGGKNAMEEMIAHLTSDHYSFGINLVDGPRGPIGQIKPGSIRMAQKSKAGIVPVYFMPSRIWQARSWDQFIIPKPFSKVTMRFGDIIKIDEQLTQQEFEEQRLCLENTMAPYLVKNH